MPLPSKVVLVTGASSGIGKATAERLLDDGHVVYGAARRVERMQGLVDRGGNVVSMDVTDRESIDSAIDGLLNAEGRIDVLVNNAGYAIYGAVEDVLIDDAKRQFEVNLFGLAAITKRVLPMMRAQRSGTIVNISSMGGKVYTPLGAWYHATKHALEGWSDCLRLELRAFGIDVVIVEPGIIETEFGDVLMQPMVDRSAGSPYEELASRIEKATRRGYEDGGGSPPSVIAGVISRAINSKRPRSRYAAGRYSKVLIRLRTYLGDRMFDRIVMSQVR